ncbi:MAG: hypothetical protein KF834_07635 [Burkholderiales bacterium]|nr:hypothetical protein [Burkholderiales bacterium]
MARTDALKPAIFALLAVNAAVYATAGRLSEGLDALAWYLLLALFELETRRPRWSRRPRVAAALGLLRLLAAAAVAVAAAAYLGEAEWLDAANALLWIGVVIVLELEVRLPQAAARQRRLAAGASFALYAALATVALAWLLRGEWLDAYDALLWIAAFVLIELDLFRKDARENL